jgi:hypothetical protein
MQSVWAEPDEEVKTSRSPWFLNILYTRRFVLLLLLFLFRNVQSGRDA